MQIHLYLERLVERKLLENGQSNEDESVVDDSNRVTVTKDNFKDIFKI